MFLDTTALAGALQQILLTFAQLSPAQTSLYWAVVRATEQLSVVVEQRSGPSAVVEERVSGDDTGSMTVAEKHERDLPKKLLLEAAMQTRLPPSSPTPSPVAVPYEEIGDEEKCVDDTSAITDEEQEDTTIEQGTLMNHEPADEEPDEASDPNRTPGEIQNGEIRNGRRSQDADTLSSWSPLSTPPASGDEHDGTSDALDDEPKSLAASIESSTLDGGPRRPPRSAAAKARGGLASHKGAVHRQKRTNKTAATKEQQVASIAVGLGGPAVMTLIQESMDHAQALQSTLVFEDSPYRPSGSGSPMMSLFVSLGRQLSDHLTGVWVSTVLHRINLAFFDRIYQVAKNDVRKSAYSSGGSSFLRESEALLLAQSHKPACTFAVGHRSPSVVRDRLVDLIFLDGRPHSNKSRDRVRARVAAIQQLGKRWQRVIDRFGYEMLLLLPSDITSNRMKVTDAQMDILMTLLKSQRARLSADCVAKARKALDHTFMPYVRQQEEIFREDGGFLSLPSFLTVPNRKETSPGGGETRSSNLAGSEMDMLDGQDSGMLGVQSASSRHLPDLRTLDEDVDNEDEQVLVDDKISTNDEDWAPELQLIGAGAHSHRTESESPALEA